MTLNLLSSEHPSFQFPKFPISIIQSPNASPICSICIQIKKRHSYMLRSDFFFLNKLHAEIKIKNKISFLHTNTIIVSTINFALQFKILWLGRKIGIPFVNTISTHTLHLAFLLPSLCVVIIVSLNSSHQLLTQERFGIVVPFVSIENISN